MASSFPQPKLLCLLRNPHPDRRIYASRALSPLSGRVLSLRLEALDPPGSIFAAIDQPVVKPILASLPELDLFGFDPVAAPERWAWDLTSLVLRLECPYPLFQNVPVLDGAALLGSPRPETAPSRTAREVGVGLFPGETAGAALDPDLPLQLAPVEK